MDERSLVSDVEGLSGFISLDSESKKEIERISKVYPFRVPQFYAGLMERENPLCPIRLQAVPSAPEHDRRGIADPLGEGQIAMTPSFFKRYPGRGVFLVSGECAMYCRFCNRRRIVGKGFRPETSREESLAYLERSDDIREVIVSGGDPLMLEPAELEYVLARLRRIGHIGVVRVSTRVPVVFPEGLERQRDAIKRHGPLWFIVHINHPREVTPEFTDAVRKIQEAGVIVISQTVLLRRVNDCVHILARLFERLIERGVKPYYLFQLDDVIGATHFKVRLETGIGLMRELRRSISGLCMPQYAVDITGGLGKIPLENGYIKGRDGQRVSMESLYGQEGIYMDDGEETKCNNCGICRS
ncbi:MAG: KamA family radical SAM protein [Syntrophorhabdales bacterium]|jgi:lysine 2,3-aminomutase